MTRLYTRLALNVLVLGCTTLYAKPPHKPASRKPSSTVSRQEYERLQKINVLLEQRLAAAQEKLRLAEQGNGVFTV